MIYFKCQLEFQIWKKEIWPSPIWTPFYYPKSCHFRLFLETLRIILKELSLSAPQGPWFFSHFSNPIVWYVIFRFSNYFSFTFVQFFSPVLFICTNVSLYTSFLYVRGEILIYCNFQSIMKNNIAYRNKIYSFQEVFI